VKVNMPSMTAMFNVILVHNFVGRDSADGIATRYGLYGPGIKCRWGHPSRPAPGPTQPRIQWIPDLAWGQSCRGAALTTHTHLAPRLKKEYSYISTPSLGLRGLFYGELLIHNYNVTCFGLGKAVTVRLSSNFILVLKFIHLIQRTELVSGETSVTVLHSS
jgi:hypothetical protein